MIEISWGNGELTGHGKPSPENVKVGVGVGTNTAEAAEDRGRGRGRGSTDNPGASKEECPVTPAEGS